MSSNPPTPDPTPKPQPTLPVELIQLILHHSPTPTYLKITHSSRKLYEIGSTCREVILHHLHQLPIPVPEPVRLDPSTGSGSGTNRERDIEDHQLQRDHVQNVHDSEDGIETRELFDELVIRARRALFGVEMWAGCVWYYFRTGFVEKAKVGLGIDGRACSIRCTPSIIMVDSMVLMDVKIALVVRGYSNVNIYSIRPGGQLAHVRRVDPPWIGTGSTGEPGAKVEVVRTCFNRDLTDLYVLYRVQPLAKGGGQGQNQTDATHPFVAEAMRSSPQWETYLVRYALNCDGRCTHSGCGARYVCGFPDHVGFEPVALAIGEYDCMGECAFGISWRGMDGVEDEVVLYTITGEEDTDEKGIVGSFPSKCWTEYNEMRPLTDAELSYESHPLVYTRDHDTSILMPTAGNQPPIIRPSPDPRPVVGLAFNQPNGEILLYSKGHSIFGSFQQASWDRAQPNENPAQFSRFNLPFSVDIPFFGLHLNCSPNQAGRRRYLALGMTMHRLQGWRVACLLMGEKHCPTAGCGYVFDADEWVRLYNWRAVARLWGFPRADSTLRCVIAASRGGTRLAVADWKMLYVWTIEPEAFTGGIADKVYPQSWWSRKLDMVELRPVVLQLRAVCFKLQFMDGENDLLAITDRGVMYWELSPGTMGTGKRTSHQLNLI